MTIKEQRNLEEIYSRLKTQLRKDTTFVQPGLNRSRLARMLGTNEKYLIKALRYYEDKSPNEYIIALRMEYALHLLQKYPEYTIDAIALECGVRSRSTFFRVFRKHYGCTPDKIRRNENQY